ncbi:MAG: ABC transporter substrate-binding protein [Bacteroidetes bacterium]|nr:ABC transporter substrate-binding protein [Bacteroidota bacterium]MCY4206225.1 ABC transporter substrate-binding protein [Bacteroidota bacterium]
MNYHIKLVALSVLIALFVAACSTEEAPYVTAVSWGGSYGKAVNESANIPFSEETGIEVRVEDYNGGLAQIRAQVEIGEVHWDVVDLEIADAVRGCDEGLLEPIDFDMLTPAPDGTPASEDFPDEVKTGCGIGSLVYSNVYAYNAETIRGPAPETPADFFDLEKIPGRRGLRRVPHVNLEFALLADGVPANEVYAVMSTPKGLDRAFAKLETIKDQVDWWEAGAQPPQMLADGQVVMSTAYNGRIFNAQVLEDQPFVIVWDGQVYDIGQASIVAGTPRLAEARKYVAFLTSTESLARIGERISYSSVRNSGQSLVTTHLTTGVDMAPHLPANPDNMRNALRFDWAWWADHQDELNERFSAWLAL